MLLLTNCSRSPYLSLKPGNKKQIIALLPFGSYDKAMLDDLAFDLKDFYRKQIILLNPIDIPKHYYDQHISQYSGDSLLTLSSKFINDTVVEVVGFVHDPIFTIKRNQGSHIDYYEETLLGISHQPGNTCVISDFKLKSEDKTLYHFRLKKVIIHELGHNLGLSHCLDDKCIMSEKTGSTINLDKTGSDYCQKCKKILYN